MRTVDNRGSGRVLEQYSDIIGEIRGSKHQQDYWIKYQKNFDYAKDISFDDACNTIQRILDDMMKWAKCG